MDKIWNECGCSNKRFDQESYAKFYGHPIWLLHGLYLESDSQAISQRQAICDYLNKLSPQNICDYGGGFGTLARIAAKTTQAKNIHIYEPHPPRYGKSLCAGYPQITYVSSMEEEYYDALISTDVLEHTQDPILCLSLMVRSVRIGGYLALANCFYPAIACHLPSTFHLRYSFDDFCEALGLTRVGPCEGSHATIYKKACNSVADWRKIRRLEKLSQATYIAREAKSSAISVIPASIKRVLKIIRRT